MASACAIEFLLIPCVCVCVHFNLGWGRDGLEDGLGVWIELGPSETPEVAWMAAPSGSVCRQDAEGVGSSRWAGNI